MHTIGIIGGGASGLFAAVTAAKLAAGGVRVVVFEREPRVGKKLLKTGNGRGNITNTNACKSHYTGRDAEFAQKVLEVLPPGKTIEFFNGIGLLCKTEYGGRVFPYSGQASAVLDVLRFSAELFSVEFVLDYEVRSIDFAGGKANGKFHVRSAAADSGYVCDKVIAACGGVTPAGVKSGSYGLLTAFGHTLTPLSPALVSIAADTAHTKGLAGLKTAARVKAYAGGKPAADVKGDVLFTEYGVSGSAILDISGVFYNFPYVTLEIDFVNDYNEAELFELLLLRKKTFGDYECGRFFAGMIDKRFGNMILKRALAGRMPEYVRQLPEKALKEAAVLLKRFPVTNCKPNGFMNAQVTAGGIVTNEFCAETCESKLVPGLYAAGEILDIFGACGGYNLQFAWSTGYAAGKHAALPHPDSVKATSKNPILNRF